MSEYKLSDSRQEYLDAVKNLQRLQKDLRKKHSSKVYKGFCKMCLRQDNKPSDVTINLPEYNKLPKNFKGDYIHCFSVNNSRWNGMNLKTLCNQKFYRVGYFKSPFQINPLTGKYSLTMTGQQKLKRMKEHKLKQLIDE